MKILSDNLLYKIKQAKKINIRISNYGKVNEIISNRLKQRIEEFDIPYYMHNFASGNGAWFDCGSDPYMKRLSEEEMKKNFNSCVFKYGGCITLENGFISICSRAAIAHIAQNFEIKNKIDGFFIRQNIKYSQLFDFLYDCTPVEACYYCLGTHKQKTIPPAEQMNREELNEVAKFVYARTRPDPTRPDPTRPDPTRPDPGKI